MGSQMNLFPHLDPESSSIELKTCEHGTIPSDLWKTISAFSNTEGGQIYCGVRPDTTPIGLDQASIDKVQQDIVSLCQNGFNYQINPTLQVIGSVVVISIPIAPSVVRPIYSTSRGITNGAYTRIGSSNIRMSDEIRNQFAVAARGGAELIEYHNLSSAECFEDSLLTEYIEKINYARNDIYSTIPSDEILRKIRATNNNNIPTLFGLLVFSKDTVLQQVTAPTTNVAVTHYSGTTKTNPIDTNQIYRDNREFNGNVVRQFNEAFRFIKSKLPISGTIDSDGKRREYLVIPEVALREALANAIAHRDYSTMSSRVQVDIFADRIEITNPGQSLVPIEKIYDTPSVARNPYLMGFLKEYHITEQLARGIQTIRESSKAAGLAEPLFENLSSSFRITLYSSAFLSGADHIWLRQFSSENLNSHQLSALTHMRNTVHGINNVEYRDINQMNGVGDDRRARHELEKLKSLSIIIPRGEKRYRRYYLAKKYQP